MNKNLHRHWSDLICPLFPKDTKFIPFDDFDDFITKASWRLNTDPKRPNKRSKIVKIIISSVAIDDYENKSTAKKQEDDKKLLRYVEQFLKEFNPDYDVPYGDPAPEVNFVVDGNVLNS